VNDIKCITIGALIHDIGHGPYSHLFDELVNPLKNHEYRSIELLKYMKTKYELDISDEDIIKISNIIHPVNQI
jgi:HD superfamily phosphohydrolase